MSPESKCEDCGGTGYVVVNDIAKPCHCLKPALFSRHVKQAGIPERFWNPAKGIEATLSKYKTTTPAEKESLAVLKAWITGSKTSREWLFLFGPVGTGKSYLASALLLEICRRHGATIRFITTFDLLAGIKKEFNSDGSGRDFDGDGIYDQLAKIGLLAIDDIGNARATDFAVEQIGNLIDSRWRDDKPTILTSNLTLDALADIYGQRFISRVRGAGPVLQFNGKDRRLQAVTV